MPYSPQSLSLQAMKLNIDVMGRPKGPRYDARDELTRLTYLDWQDLYNTEKPYQVFSAVPQQQFPDYKSTNLVFKDGELERIHDVRGSESSFSLDVHGFAFRHHELSDITSWTTAEIETHYFQEMEALLRQEVDDVDQVYFFDWRIRKNVDPKENSVVDGNDRMQPFLPARHVHIDQTPSAVVGRIKLHLPEESDFLLKCRVRVINLWRPLVAVIEDRPLALCDATTIESSDLVEADHVRKHYSGSNYYAKPSSRYRWYYLNQQRRNEVTLMKMFDSLHGKAQATLHTSFEHQDIPDNAHPRESIEVRALVFTYPGERAEAAVRCPA